MNIKVFIKNLLFVYLLLQISLSELAQKKHFDDLQKYEVGALAPINKSEQTLSFVPKVITENQILKEINKVKEEILHLLNMQKEHILKGHKRSLGALVKNKQKEIGNLLKKCK